MKTMQKPLSNVARTNQLRSWLESIRANHPKRMLVVAEVVDHARDPSSPGHGEFTWDDGVAADRWREHEARSLIRQVYVLEESGSKSPAFVSLLPDRRERGGGYRAVGEVLSSAQLREQLRETAEKELDAWRQRYAMLTDLVDKVSSAAGLKPLKKGGTRKRKPK